MSSFNIPILTSDRADYSVGNDYETRVLPSTESNYSYHIRHEVKGKNLVSQLLLDDDALFAVEVCAPASTFRKMFVVSANGSTSCAQEIHAEQTLVAPPVYVRPLVISDVRKTLEISLDGSHGVHEIWQGEKISIGQATILALGEFSTRSGIHSLLKLIEVDDLPNGSFRIQPNSSDGFYFEMCVPNGLFTAVRNPEIEEHRDSLLTAGLASGFHYLKRECAEADEWQQHVALIALNQYLRDMNLPTWDDPDFSPEEVATRLKPIHLAGLEDAG